MSRSYVNTPSSHGSTANEFFTPLSTAALEGSFSSLLQPDQEVRRIRQTILPIEIKSRDEDQTISLRSRVEVEGDGSNGSDSDCGNQCCVKDGKRSVSSLGGDSADERETFRWIGDRTIGSGRFGALNKSVSSLSGAGAGSIGSGTNSPASSSFGVSLIRPTTYIRTPSSTQDDFIDEIMALKLGGFDDENSDNKPSAISQTSPLVAISTPALNSTPPFIAGSLGDSSSSNRSSLNSSVGTAASIWSTSNRGSTQASSRPTSYDFTAPVNTGLRGDVPAFCPSFALNNTPDVSTGSSSPKSPLMAGGSPESDFGVVRRLVAKKSEIKDALQVARSFREGSNIGVAVPKEEGLVGLGITFGSADSQSEGFFTNEVKAVPAALYNTVAFSSTWNGDDRAEEIKNGFSPTNQLRSTTQPGSTASLLTPGHAQKLHRSHSQNLSSSATDVSFYRESLDPGVADQLSHLNRRSFPMGPSAVGHAVIPQGPTLRAQDIYDRDRLSPTSTFPNSVNERSPVTSPSPLPRASDFSPNIPDYFSSHGASDRTVNLSLPLSSSIFDNPAELLQQFSAIQKLYPSAFGLHSDRETASLFNNKLHNNINLENLSPNSGSLFGGLSVLGVSDKNLSRFPFDNGYPSNDSLMGPSPTNKKGKLYKTELCRSWESRPWASDLDRCMYGAKCQYAHGLEELRPVDRHPKYKTQICTTFWLCNFCAYGRRCCFIHDEVPAGGLPELGVFGTEAALRAILDARRKIAQEELERAAYKLLSTESSYSSSSSSLIGYTPQLSNGRVSSDGRQLLRGRDRSDSLSVRHSEIPPLTPEPQNPLFPTSIGMRRHTSENDYTIHQNHSNREVDNYLTSSWSNPHHPRMNVDTDETFSSTARAAPSLWNNSQIQTSPSFRWSNFPLVESSPSWEERSSYKDKKALIW